MPPRTCSNHPGAPAELECPGCVKLLCPACVRPLRDGRTMACQACDGLALPFQATKGPVSRAAVRAETDRPLYERLPGTILYLKQPTVLLVMLGLAVLNWIGGLNFILWVVAAGTQAAVFFRIVESTAFGDDRLEAPDFIDLWESILSPLVRYLATLLPLIVLVFLARIGLYGLALPPRPLVAALGPYAIGAAIWLLLWPLLIMVAAITRSTLAVFNPVQWWHVLSEMRMDYVLGALAFYATLLVDAYLFAPLAIRALVHAPIPVVVPVLIHFGALLLMAWRARILGEACRPYVE